MKQILGARECNLSTTLNAIIHQGNDKQLHRDITIQILQVQGQTSNRKT